MPFGVMAIAPPWKAWVWGFLALKASIVPLGKASVNNFLGLFWQHPPYLGVAGRQQRIHNFCTSYAEVMNSRLWIISVI